MKTVILAITGDPYTDQRVLRVASTLRKNGLNALLVGRRSKLPVRNDFECKCIRWRMLFDRNFMFYAEFNIRLFFLLLFRNASLIVSNDLDTLPACWLVARIKMTTLIYDAHEFFTAQAGMENRRFVRKFWEALEGFLIPRIKYMTTVNESIAGLYEEKYGIRPVVVRNLSKFRKSAMTLLKPHFNPGSKKMLILQGTGINVGRGGEEAVLAMKHVENAVLVIAGDGLVVPELKRMVRTENLEEKVVFLPTMDYGKLMELTAMADLGLSLDKAVGLNQKFSLPNKLFDYVQARIPVLASNLPEVRRIITEYQIGLICKEVTPENISKCVNQAVHEKKLKSILSEKLEKAARELCWEREEIVLENFYHQTGLLQGRHS